MINKEVGICHPVEEVQAQGVHEAEAAHAVGVAARQADEAVHPTAALIVAHTVTIAEIQQPILQKECEQINPPVCRRTLKQSRLY